MFSIEGLNRDLVNKIDKDIMFLSDSSFARYLSTYPFNIRKEYLFQTFKKGYATQILIDSMNLENHIITTN